MKRWLFALTGMLLFLAPLKFSVPVNLQSQAVPPTAFIEWVFWSWPNQIGVMATAVLVFLLAQERSPVPRRGLLGVLPMLFLVTQVIAVPTSICWQTTVDTLLHFGACVVMFYAASRCAREEHWEPWLLGALAAATALVCVAALEQQFGGLDATRRYATAYVDSSRMTEELQAKLTSKRVFGTLPYPNALAGYLVVVFAPALAWLWSKAEGLAPKIIMVVAAGSVMVACLALSGSRGGFVALAAGVLAWLMLRKCSGRQWLWSGVVLAVVLAVSLKGGVVRFGRSSLEARMDYWGGAVRIIRDYPWLGTGPGTFGSIYPKYKTAATEEAQLVHNNFLEMWSDSGVAAFVVFAALWAVGLWEAVRLARQRGDMVSAALLAAVAAWTVHGLVDFDLYVPGIAWSAFALLGVVHGLSRPCQPQTNSRRWLQVGVGVGVGVVLWFEVRMFAAAVAYGKAQMLVGEDRLRAAVAATWRAPRNPHYWAAVGDAALQLKGSELAVKNYKNAVDLDPERSARYARLARAYWAMGNQMLAVEALRWAAALNPTEQVYRQELKAAEESVRQRREQSGKVPPILRREKLN